MNSGPFANDDERNGVPSARPAQGKKDDANIPDWAKITADFDDLPDDDTSENDIPPAAPDGSQARPASPYGAEMPDLDELDALDEIEPEPEPIRESAPRPEPTPSYEDEYEPDVVAAPPKQSAPVEEEVEERRPRKEKPKRHTPMSKALTRLPANKYKTPPENESSAKGKKYRGGRWKVLALRAGVWSSFGMILLVGVFTIIGPKGPSLTAVTNNVLSEINRNAFPLEEGEQLASRFIERYLTYDPSDTVTRAEELNEYVMDRVGGAGSSVSLFNASRPQSVTDGPYLAAPAELVSDNHVVYTFAVEVENPGYVLVDQNNSQNLQVLDPIAPRWIYIAVPMVADAEGHIAVADVPALVPQPPKAEGVEELRIDVDRDASLASKSSMEQFFKLWGESFQEGLRPYLVVGQSTEAAQIGLRGTAEFVSLNSLDVSKLPDDYEPDPEVPPMCTGPDYEAPCRDAIATVTWKFPDDSEFSQSYRMIIFNDGQNWRVIDIRGGKFDSLGR
jgi:hypothetical protein